MYRRREKAMNNPLAVSVTIWLITLFACSWGLLVGHWIGLNTFSYDQRIIGELVPLAYGGAILSVGFATAIVAVKLRHR